MDEDLDIKVNLNGYENFIRNNRKPIAIVLILIMLIMGFYCVYNRDKIFNKLIIYRTDDGLYNCNETYRFGKNITPVCVIPDMYKRQPNLPLLTP